MFSVFPGSWQWTLEFWFLHILFSLSNDTIRRRIDDMTADVCSKLAANSSKARSSFQQLDKST